MEQASLELLELGLRQYGIQPTGDMIRAIVRHLEMVVEWNERINLTAITAERDMVVKHALDSASVFGALDLKPGMRLLDVGTGAGFPGVVLKCIVPELSVSLLESLQKRCKFLEAVGEEVIGKQLRAVSGYDVIWGRAEDLGQDARFRERFDIVMARAVAELRVLSEYCLPFCRVGGEFVAMKGPAAAEELAGAEKALTLLGGTLVEVREVELPEGAGLRSIIRIKKVRATPKAYPRRAGTPAKSPL